MNGTSKIIEQTVIESMAKLGPVIDLLLTLYNLGVVGNHEIMLQKDKLIIYWVEHNDRPMDLL